MPLGLTASLRARQAGEVRILGLGRCDRAGFVVFAFWMTRHREIYHRDPLKPKSV